MKHIIVTRCRFRDDKLFDRYFKVMESVYIPSVASQTNKNFKLYIITNRNKPEHKSLISKKFEGTGVDLIWDIQNLSKYVTVENFNMQTRHDCDDWMSADYVERIQNLYSEKIKEHDEFLIQAQPKKMDFETKEEYICRKYTEQRPSMFLTLCQKKSSKYILDEKHLCFSKIVPKSFFLSEGCVKLVIHKNNILSKLTEREKTQQQA